VIDNGRRIVVRYPTPLPVFVWLGAPVVMATPFGHVHGICVGVYRGEPFPETDAVMIEAMPIPNHPV
jgi:hypothetical protein